MALYNRGYDVTHMYAYCMLTEHAGADLAVPPQKLYGRDLSVVLVHAPSAASQQA